MGVRTHVGTYVRRYAAHTYVRIAAEQILKCVCLEKGAWLRAHVRVAGSGQRRRRSEKEKGPISYVRCAYVRTYLVQSSDTYADVRAYIRTYVRTYIRLIASVTLPAPWNLMLFRTLRCTMADRLVLMAIASAYLHLPRASSVRTHVQDHHAQFVWL